MARRRLTPDFRQAARRWGFGVGSAAVLHRGEGGVAALIQRLGPNLHEEHVVLVSANLTSLQHAVELLDRHQRLHLVGDQRGERRRVSAVHLSSHMRPNRLEAHGYCSYRKPHAPAHLIVSEHLVQLLELILGAGYREGRWFWLSVLSLSLNFLSLCFGLFVLLRHAAVVSTRAGETDDGVTQPTRRTCVMTCPARTPAMPRPSFASNLAILSSCTSERPCLSPCTQKFVPAPSQREGCCRGCIVYSAV